LLYAPFYCACDGFLLLSLISFSLPISLIFSLLFSLLISFSFQFLVRLIVAFLILPLSLPPFQQPCSPLPLAPFRLLSLSSSQLLSSLVS